MFEWGPKVVLERLINGEVPRWDEASVLRWQGDRAQNIDIVAEKLDGALGILVESAGTAAELGKD